MSVDKEEKKLAWRYQIDRGVRGAAMFVMKRVMPRIAARGVDLRQEKIERILLVRGVYRLGNAILATPAILLFRKNFPHARIDFVGGSGTERLFSNLPIDRYYSVYHHYIKASWSYPLLLRQIRAQHYDLAVDVSGSSTAMGAFLVGTSGARFRAGLAGKWDGWFNLRYPRSGPRNKYDSMMHLVGAMGLENGVSYPRIILSPAEMVQGSSRLGQLLGRANGAIVGIFVGGRKARGKRWAKEKFLQLAVQLHRRGVRVILFVGPEEQDLVGYYEREIGACGKVLFEPDLRRFAALIAGCQLFVACDSGPVHLACALQVRTVAIFLHDNFDRWGPPAELARIIYDANEVTVPLVVEACHQELFFSPATFGGYPPAKLVRSGPLPA